MENKINTNYEERRIFRQNNYRSELKTDTMSSFKIISSGKKKNSPSRNLAALTSIRRILYPELANGLRMDKNIVNIIRKEQK